MDRMKRILHILKQKEDLPAVEIIRAQAQSNAVTVLLIQDAVDLELQGVNAQVFALAEDAKNQMKPFHPQIGYKEMLAYILDSETVVTW